MDLVAAVLIWITGICHLGLPLAPSTAFLFLPLLLFHFGFLVLGIKLKASCVPGQHSTMELDFKALDFLFLPILDFSTYLSWISL